MTDKQRIMKEIASRMGYLTEEQLKLLLLVILNILSC